MRLSLRTTAAALCCAILLAACGTAPAPPPTPPEAGGPPPAPVPAEPAAPEPAVLLLDVELGAGRDQPGMTTPRVGGVSERGPTSLAVDSAGRIYLWDAARSRVLVYSGGRLQRALDMPYVNPGQAHNVALLEHAGRLYLTAADFGRMEFAAHAATGALVGAALFPGDAPGTLYPRPRGAPPDPNTKRPPAPDDIPTLPGAVDTYAAPDGGVYALTWVYGPAGPARVQVWQVRAPSGAAPEPPAPPPPAAPLVAGRPVPDAVDVQAPGLPPGRLEMPADRAALWRLLAAGRPESGGPPSGGEGTIHLAARWQDGSSLPIAVGPYWTEIGGEPYRVPLRSVRGLVLRELVRPDRYIAAARRHGAAVRIPDLPGVERRLDAGEIELLAAALGSAFPVTDIEPPLPLDPPFPRYQVAVSTPAGEAVLELAGPHHLWATPEAGLAHDGSLARLVEEWLPAPAATPDQPAYLYQATALAAGEGEHVKDLSHWKATVVRALLGAGPAGDPAYPYHGPLVLTFTVGGEPHRVVVTDQGFTYAGTFHPRPGLHALASLQSVP